MDAQHLEPHAVVRFIFPDAVAAFILGFTLASLAVLLVHAAYSVPMDPRRQYLLLYTLTGVFTAGLLKARRWLDPR
jgi:hypothetical protein